MLTPILTFHNEGDGVAKTLQSIKETVTGDVHALLIDDCSTDGYDYEALVKEYGADYYRMDKKSGTIGTRTKGAELCKTDKFVFLDGHMIFYHKGWDERLEALLDDYPESIITSRTVIIRPDEEGNWITEDENDPDHHGVSWGAYLSFERGLEFEPKWTSKELRTNDERVNQCACVLGAVYAMKKSWWNEIDGLNGFVGYGLDESLMSIKTWLMGGQCLIVRDWGVGHLYRMTRPKDIPVEISNIDANRLFLTMFFKPCYAYSYAKNIEERKGRAAFSVSYTTFMQMHHDMRFDFWKRAKHRMEYFEQINEKVKDL